MPVRTPVQAICFAERCALLTGNDIDFEPWLTESRL
jgi:hypothetical protein